MITIFLGYRFEGVVVLNVSLSFYKKWNYQINEKWYIVVKHGVFKSLYNAISVHLQKTQLWINFIFVVYITCPILNAQVNYIFDF